MICRGAQLSLRTKEALLATALPIAVLKTSAQHSPCTFVGCDATTFTPTNRFVTQDGAKFVGAKCGTRKTIGHIAAACREPHWKGGEKTSYAGPLSHFLCP